MKIEIDRSGEILHELAELYPDLTAAEAQHIAIVMQEYADAEENQGE